MTWKSVTILLLVSLLLFAGDCYDPSSRYDWGSQYLDPYTKWGWLWDTYPHDSHFWWNEWRVGMLGPEIRQKDNREQRRHLDYFA